MRASASVPVSSSGYDGGKKVPGRKRHIVTDTLGLLLVVAVTAANVGDRDAAVPLLRRLRSLHREITLVWADGGYTGGLVSWCRQELALTLEVVKRTDAMEGFVVLPRRWVVERSLAWIMNARRHARDYERLVQHSESLITWAAITLVTRRISRQAHGTSARA
ncbi:transposase [Streptomyces sp. NPDC090053]|uniref:transposase n=1 Tax=Streptomyces sp. NPDC090053 TaxID=3365932 RepID=UPI00382C355E